MTKDTKQYQKEPSIGAITTAAGWRVLIGSIDCTVNSSYTDGLVDGEFTIIEAPVVGWAVVTHYDDEGRGADQVELLYWDGEIQVAYRVGEGESETCLVLPPEHPELSSSELGEFEHNARSTATYFLAKIRKRVPRKTVEV